MKFQFKKSQLAIALLMSLPLIASAVDSDVTQTATNDASVANGATGEGANSITISGTDPALGAGASASISASGAVTSVSVTNNFATTVNSNDVTIPNFGAVDQTATNSGVISNYGLITFSATEVMESGASASISASGAVSSLSQSSYSVVNTDPATPAIGNITQISTNTGVVTNEGEITGTSTTVLSGDGASVSISATGAVASISSTFNGATLAGASTYTYGVIDQTATNGSSGEPGVSPEVNNTSTDVTVGALSGNGASASVSASGAVASLGFTLNNTDNLPTSSPIVATYGTITQEAKNYGDITNTGGSLSVGAITGHGASAAISASGSVASFSIASISSDNINLGNFGAITQTSNNYGAVVNTGNMVIAGAFGVGASASISASGAVTSVSFKAVQ